MKEILLYGQIYSSTAEAFINACNEVGEEGVSVRINGDGGSPEYGWGMIAKYSEIKSKKLIKVDGKAHSMYAYFLCYADDAEALDVAQITIHRGGYADWVESNPAYMTQGMIDSRDFMNKKLRRALESKIDVAKFEAMKGVTLDQIFSNDSRIDVTLTAAEAKKIGLINRVVNITPAIKAEVESLYQMAAHVQPEAVTKPTQPIITKMDISKFRNEHPDVYAQVIALGVAQEKDRVEACMVFNEIDPAGVKAAIESGKPLSAKQMADFTLKAVSGKRAEDIAAEASPEVKTDEAKKKETEAQAKVSDFEMQARKELIKPKN